MGHACNPGPLEINPQHPVSKLSTEHCRWRQKHHASLPDSQFNQLSPRSSERLLSKIKMESGRGRHLMVTSGFHECIHIPVHMHTHTNTNTTYTSHAHAYHICTCTHTPLKVFCGIRPQGNCYETYLRIKYPTVKLQ